MGHRMTKFATHKKRQKGKKGKKNRDSFNECCLNKYGVKMSLNRLKNIKPFKTNSSKTSTKNCLVMYKREQIAQILC